MRRAACPAGPAASQTRGMITEPETPILHPRPDWRVGDAERTRTCDVLAANHALGRLSAADLDERLEAAVHAVRRRDLDTLLDDLPPLTEAPPPPAPRPTPLRDAGEGLLLMAALGAVGVVSLMLLGSLLWGQGVFGFALVGGSLTLFFTAVFTRAKYTHPLSGGTAANRQLQRPQSVEQPQA